MKRESCFVRGFLGVAVCLLVVLSGPVAAQAPAALVLTLNGTVGGNAQAAQIALGDVDRDGDLDAVFANMHGVGRLWLNDGRGAFTPSEQLFRVDTTSVAVGDLDADGNLDLFFATGDDESGCTTYRNDGTGRFSLAQTLPNLRVATSLVSLVDLEGDGDLDAAVYYNSLRTVLYLNDGVGHFQAGATEIPGMTLWGDLDGDGDSDAVAVSPDGEYRTLLNDGVATFVDVGALSAPAPDVPGSVGLGDIDGDGDLDLVVVPGESGPRELALLLNDGGGSFRYVSEPRMPVPMGRVTLGDLDGDGRPDAFLGCLALPNLVGWNCGGGFIASGLSLGGPYCEGKSAIGDLDGDGDLDILVARYLPQGPSEIWLNGVR